MQPLTGRSCSKFKFLVRVLQMKLQLALKDNEQNQQDVRRLAIKKELDKEKQQSQELRSQMDSLKLLIRQLDEDIAQLHSANDEQKVSLRLVFTARRNS